MVRDSWQIHARRKNSKQMNFKSVIKSCCESIGKNNNPAYVVVAIATAKGIFRPLFTMADKKESPETKKYAALREGLTEVIAIPTYLSCSYLAGKGANLFKDPEKAKMAKHNLKFAGVCTAALLVIPGLCSIVVNPFTDRIFHKNDKPKDKSQQHLDVVSQTEKAPIYQNTTKINTQSPMAKVSLTGFLNTGMKV